MDLRVELGPAIERRRIRPRVSEFEVLVG